MENLALKKGETKIITLLEIKTKKEKNGKVFNIFFNGTLEQAKLAANWINQRILISAAPKEVEVIWDENQKDYLNKEGFLDAEYFTQNPNEISPIKNSDVAEAEEDEEMKDFWRSIGE